MLPRLTYGASSARAIVIDKNGDLGISLQRLAKEDGHLNREANMD